MKKSYKLLLCKNCALLTCSAVTLKHQRSRSTTLITRVKSGTLLARNSIVITKRFVKHEEEMLYLLQESEMTQLELNVNTLYFELRHHPHPVDPPVTGK